MAEESNCKTKPKDGKNLVRQFISAKRIEGCSKRTEEYYLNTLKFFEKNIKCDCLSADTNTIREYLIDYQKINNCSNVTLDTVRRILSSFYKWLEEEDYILKSPMKRIHKIRTPITIKPAFSDEQIDNVHPHRFRRTMATRAIDKGMPIEQVQVLLGHTKIDTTLRYANVQQSNVKEKIYRNILQDIFHLCGAWKGSVLKVRDW